MCDLHIVAYSHNCRSVMMACKAACIDCVNIKEVNMGKGEHMTPEFLKMNPHHTVPTLNDNGFYLYESRPIMCYLVDKYGKKDSVFPKDCQKRAVVNKWLYYDLGNIASSIVAYLTPHLFGKPPKPLDPAACKKVVDALKSIDQQLCKTKFICGDEITLPDLSMSANVSLLELIEFDHSEIPSVARWYKDMKAQPFWEECNKGLYALKAQMQGS